jgi:GntR family transcriptional repressor for pyruvate dehydrogenase complex
MARTSVKGPGKDEVGAEAGVAATPPHIRTISLAEGAAVKIAGEINSGMLRPGQRLPPERDLAQHLGLSRGALREGLRTVESAGLVTARVGQGRFVNDPGSERSSIALNTFMQLQPSGDILAVRRLLEPAAIRDLPAAQLSNIAASAADLLAKMRRAQAAGAITQAVRHHTEFHLLLARFGSTRLLRTLLSSLIEASTVWQPSLLHDRQTARFWVRRHMEILEALESGDIERTAHTVRDHLQLVGYPD